MQEALTNARRHAPGAAVDVELRYADDALRLRVRDNGPGPAAAGAGDAGDRRSADRAGRTLAPAAGTGCSGCGSGRSRWAARCGPGAAPGGGFLVEAVLPANRSRRAAGAPARSSRAEAAP